MNYKFPSAYRLLRSDDFNQVIGSTHIANRYYKVFYSKNIVGHGRLGIIVSSRIMPRAVERNTVKRHIRELFRKHPIKNQSLDVVVIVKSDFDKLTPNDGNLVELLTKVDYRCTEFSSI